MIVYESNKNWLLDLKHLFASWTMKVVIRSTAIVMFCTALICFIQIDILNILNSGLDVTIFSLLGVVLSILLSFRTTTAYDRWWEGRKQWGDLVNNCRNLAIYIMSSFPAEDISTKHSLAIKIANYCIALKEHLRGGVKIEELVYIGLEEKIAYSQKVYLPGYIALEIVTKIQEAFIAGRIRGEDHLNIKLHTQEFLNIAGACERIRKTPIPFSYNVYIKLFIMVYAVCLPFALIPLFAYWSIIMVGFVFFAFIGLELMAEEIEEPFGLDCNDLPIGDIAHTIKNNVFELLEFKIVVEEEKDKLYTKVF